MYDFVDTAFELAFKYRTPAMILSDGVIGQMMEKVELRPIKPRRTNEQIIEQCGEWALTGKTADRKRNLITSLALDPNVMSAHNIELQKKYKTIMENEQQYTTYKTEDAEYLIVAYGSMSRIAESVVDTARENGIKLGVLRPITLFPYPEKALESLIPQLKKILVVEMSAGQMVEDVKLVVNGRVPVEFYGKCGGLIPSPDDVYEAFEKILK